RSRAAAFGAPTLAGTARAAGRSAPTAAAPAVRGKRHAGTSAGRSACLLADTSRGRPRGPEPGEDLPPDRVIPVPERAAAGNRRHAERSAAQHLVLRAEEHLGVLLVRPRHEPRVRQEVRVCPLPHVTDKLP